MKKQTRSILLCLFMMAGIVIASCQKEATKTEPAPSEIPQPVQDLIKSRGFSTDNVRSYNGGYLIEGDIFLDKETLAAETTTPNLRVAETEQYRTNNLVSSLPRVIKIKVVDLGNAFIQGADLAISRYNALGLTLTFQRITTGTADITIQGFYEGPSGGYITLGYAGFPGGGNPYNSISMNTHAQAYGSNPDVNYVGSVIQHEVGHCIGFRHTDYMNRAYSCGGRRYNEGSAGVGAVHISGTPTKADPNSWMLACSNGGNRTFNANDIIALNYLY